MKEGPANPAFVNASDIEAIYLHVPFCCHKCHYCDFYSITGQAPQRMGRYVDLVLREAGLWAQAATNRRGDEATKQQEERGRKKGEGRTGEEGHGGAKARGHEGVFRPRTIFFGGGTPTLLPTNQMRRLLVGLREQFDLSGVEEWTVECNPATVSPEYCAMLRQHGVDRLSFGAQSFNPTELCVLERHHEPADVERTAQIARAAGFARTNVDLIYAIPGQELGSWSDSLRRAIDLGTEHVSCYNLTYEANTPISIKKRLGQITPVEEPIELEMLHHARRTLADAGYAAYEISNYAKPGQECRHNLIYWKGGNYVGLGPSAASHIDGRRWRNLPHLGEWELAVEADRLPAADFERLAPQQRLGELVMLQLRLAEGVRSDVCVARIGMDPVRVYSKLISHLSAVGLLRVSAAGFALTERGVNVADAVAAEFLG